MSSCAFCQYGRASLVFPMSIPVEAALCVLAASDGLAVAAAEVAGHTTEKTRAAGAETVRLVLRGERDCGVEQGAHLVAVRAAGRDGWLPGLAGTRRQDDGSPLGLEIVLLARLDAKFKNVMFLPESTLRELMPMGSAVEVRFVQRMLPVQHDCPEQWLRDRLLRLANMVEESFVDASREVTARDEIRGALHRAGLRFEVEAGGGKSCVPPADTGNRVSEEELGFWDEEARLNTRCGTYQSGEERLDAYMAHLPA